MAEDLTGLMDSLGVTPTTKLTRPASPDYKGLGEKRETMMRKEAGLTSAQEAASARQLAEESRLVKGEAKQREKMITGAEKELAAARPVLEPRKDNMKDFATMFSVLSALSFATGGKGRGAGMAGLAALNGALDGWNKGQRDNFDRNMKEFEKQMSAYKQHADDVYRLLRQSVEAGGLKTEAGRLAAKEAALKDQGVIAARLEAGDAKSAFQNAEMMVKEAEKLEQLYYRRAEAQSKFTQQQMMAQRAVNSLGGVASALESLKELPAGTTTGVLPNLTTKDGLLNYVRNNIGRKISSREAEMMNTIFTGVGRNLASIEASGAATGLAELAKQMQQGLYINAGVDDPYKVAIKLADIRRVAVENILPAIKSGAMPEQQAKAALELVKRIEKAIPFDTTEVVQAARGGRGRTIGESTEKAVSRGLNQMQQRRLQELEAKERQ